MDLLAIRLWSDLAAHARLGFRVLERFNAADFDPCFTPAAGCDGWRGENYVFTFDATEEGLPLVGRKHPNQMAIRPGDCWLAEAEAVASRVGGRNELHLEINARGLIKRAG